MKIVAVVMILVGATLAYGAVLEFGFFGPESIQFWVGVFTTPAGIFFAVAPRTAGAGNSFAIRLVDGECDDRSNSTAGDGPAGNADGYDRFSCCDWLVLANVATKQHKQYLNF